ncbi:MAG: HPr family phosphocarrier protein [Spirochaetes bacterium]|nr:HPr family phosphocarrier protein [Spirochaetota bacterium]HPA72382.1 HPr family phosphocarrier protein [Spirochaetota bacterium]
MTEREVTIRSDAGIHARPAMMLVKEAMKYPCEVFLIKDRVEANGKSIMSVLALAITKGSRLIVRAVGDEEDLAVSSIVHLIEKEF